ncbi:hypothetical protein D9M68_05480 [compost metagenome]
MHGKYDDPYHRATAKGYIAGGRTTRKTLMIDISNAQLDPYRGFHYFHEDLNIYLKVALSSALLLVRHSAEPQDSDKLHDLIKLAHPSWNTPPVRDMSIDIQRRTHASISAFALISVFSAFDDFLIGTKAELHRFYSATESSRHIGMNKATPTIIEETNINDGEENDDDDDSEERLRAFYAKNGWDGRSIDPILKVVRYFRLCRNCIAHRNGRASRALVKHSSDADVHKLVSNLLDKASNGLRKYVINEDVFIEPTQAILCSHLLRKIALDANKKLLGTLGFDGFLRSVAHHTMFSETIVRSDAYKTPEAVLNFALTDRYRATMSNREECIQEMKRLGLWKKYMSEFERKYGTGYLSEY